MKKIPTLFTRVYENHKIIDILPEITPGCEQAFYQGSATIKIDGSCCAVINGEFYKRYDAKKGKFPPSGLKATPCYDPDPVTGHWPHWVLVDKTNPADKWFVKALQNSLDIGEEITDGTYEAIGPHFQGNPYGLEIDMLMPHGKDVVVIKRDFEFIKNWLDKHSVEGLVFWLDGEPVCKIKRTDFGYEWPVKGES